MRKYNARDRVFLSLSVIVFLAAASFANAQSCPVFRMTPDALKAWHNPHPSRSDFLLPLPMGLSLVFNPISLRTSNLYGDDATTTYTMGSSERRVFETNLRVRVGSPIQDARGEGVLLIGKYEVTKGQYAAVMGSGDLRRGLSILRDKTIETRTDDLLDEYLNPRSKCFGKVTRELHVLLSEPLTFLSYRDYIEFLDRLNLQCIERQDCSLKLKSLGSNDDVLGFVRLPLEHEWEYVARGGAEYIAGRITEAELQSDLPSLPSSDRITAYAHVGNDPERVVSIGSRKPLYGFYDLYGNAQELMGNVFTAENGFGAVGGYVARGGHYALNADELRASRRIELRVFRRDDRDGSLQIQYFPNTGLRLAMGFPIEDAANAGFGDREAPDAVGDQAGNTLAEARDLGLVSGTAIETREELTQSDSDDWYKVRLANYSQLKIRLLQQGSLNFALVDASGDVIERPNAQGSLTSAPLLPGEYWLRVSTPNQLTSNVDYLAQIERELVPDTGLSRPDPSELARSVSVGSRGTIFEKGFVGTGDAIDTFPVENASRLGGISAKIESKSKLTVRVLDAQLNIVAELAAADAKAGEELIASLQPSQKGFVQIEAPRGTQAVYVLELKPKSPYDPVFTPLAQGHPAQKVQDGQPYEALISGRNRLYLPLEIARNSDVRIEMTGLSDDVEMLVLNQNNRPIRSDHARAGTTAEFVSQELNSGKYVVAFRLADQTSRSSFVVTVRRTPVAISTSPSSPRPSTQLPPNGFSSDPSIIAAAKQYYETRGEWAGIYTIEARRMKVTRRGSNEIRVDLAYRFTCATSSSRCSGGRTGNDQRYFILRLINGRWVGQGMGGYQSARF